MKVRAGVAAGLRAPAPERFTTQWLATRLRSLVGPLRGQRLCLAFSGGLDSSVLLAALASLRAREGFILRALHVDHGLHPNSHLWAEAALARARALRVRCQSLRLHIELKRGESLEDIARQRRYAALIGALASEELLLTAHHQEDQLETVLLALLRGSGVRGLAAMNAITAVADTRLLRPLLPVPRVQLERFAHLRELEWTEDQSNLDERFDRNYLRRQVLPRLRQRWPAAAATALRISVLRRMSLPERRNVLRGWIAAQGLRTPDHRRLHEIAGPMLEARSDALPRVQWRGAQLRRHGDQLLALIQPDTLEQGLSSEWDWRGQPWLAFADGSRLGLVADRHGDVDLSALPCPLRVEFRQGGERLRAACGRMALKDLLQSQGIAPWERSSVPLLCDHERIVAVADLWVDAAYRAGAQGEAPRGRFRWRRRAPESA